MPELLLRVRMFENFRTSVKCRREDSLVSQFSILMQIEAALAGQGVMKKTPTTSTEQRWRKDVRSER